MVRYRYGAVRYGLDWQSWHGALRYVMFGRGLSGYGKAVLDRYGKGGLVVWVMAWQLRPVGIRSGRVWKVEAW